MSSETLKISLYHNTESLVGFPLIPKCVTLNDLEWLLHAKFRLCACRFRTSLRGFQENGASKQIQIDLYCQRQSCSLRTVVSGMKGLCGCSRWFCGKKASNDSRVVR